MEDLFGAGHECDFCSINSSAILTSTTWLSQIPSHLCMTQCRASRVELFWDAHPTEGSSSPVNGTLFSQWTVIASCSGGMAVSSKVQSSYPLSPFFYPGQNISRRPKTVNWPAPRVLISSRGARECISVGIKSFTWWHLEDSVGYHLLLLPSEQCCSCQPPGLTVVPQPSLEKTTTKHCCFS